MNWRYMKGVRGMIGYIMQNLVEEIPKSPTIAYYSQ